LTSLSWFAVLQSLISAGLVAVLWVLHARLGRRPFFLWWGWAWTMFAVYLLLGVLTLPLSATWSLTVGALAFLATVCGYLQPALLMVGVASLRSSTERGDAPHPGTSTRVRRWRTLGIAAALAAGMVAFAVSLALPDALDSFAVRVAPRAWALAAAALVSVAVFVQRGREQQSLACHVTAISCLVYSIVQAIYGVAMTGRLVAGAAGPFAAIFDADAALRPLLFLVDVVSAYGICLGMVLLLVEDFTRSRRALEESLRRQREALDENAVLQAEIAERRRVERALRDSEDRYRDLVEHSEDLICTHDLDGRILSINDPPARILGYSPGELGRMTIRQLLAPDIKDRFDAYIDELRRDGVARGLLAVMTRRGDRRMWEFRSTLRTDGVPVPIVRGMAHDVTERVKAERALRVSEAKFAAAFRASPCSIAISTLDDGRVIEINDACQRHTGYHRSEVLGVTAQELGLWIDPNDRADVVADLKAHAKVVNREVRWRSKAGDELTVLFSADTIVMDGQPHVLSVALDVTAQRQVEVRHRAILRALPDWVFLMSADGVFLDCHVKDREFLLAEPEDFIGRHVTEVLPPELASDLTRLFNHVARTDQPGTHEYFVPVAGQIRYYEVRAVRCNNRILTIVRDVTEGKRAEHQARDLRQELAHISRVSTLAALTGSLAHEIRQPLAAIRTNAQAARRLIGQPGPDVAELGNALADIVADSQRANDVIERVSALLRRETSAHGPVDVNAGLEEVVKVLRADLVARRIALAVELEPDLPRVFGDRVQLQQVALNLLMNACDAVEHQPDGSRRISLRTAVDEDSVVVSVTDYGTGLTDEQVTRAFEPFYTTRVNGMGLGLPICQMIMDLHDGILAADRNGGQGMRFSFRLPALPSAAAAVRHSAGRGESTPRGDDRVGLL
jgi:PAS domain S-box-containing protein